MPELLSPEDIDTAVGSLPGWSYDGTALVKRVQVPADSQDGLVEAVGRVAEELDHHPDTSRDEDGLTFRLWTHSVGGVTLKDVELAARIDRELSGATPDEGATS